MDLNTAKSHFDAAMQVEFPIVQYRSTYWSERKNDLVSMVNLAEALLMEYREMHSFTEQPGSEASLEEQSIEFKQTMRISARLRDRFGFESPVEDDDEDAFDPDMMAAAKREREESFFRAIYKVGTIVVPRAKALLDSINTLVEINGSWSGLSADVFEGLARTSEILDIIIGSLERNSEPAEFEVQQITELIVDAIAEEYGAPEEGISAEELCEQHATAAQAFRSAQAHLLKACAALGIEQRSGI